MLHQFVGRSDTNEHADQFSISMFHVLVALCLVGNALAQIPSFGACPNVTVQPNFDWSRYAGRWYEQERFFALFELTARCVTYDYFPGENPSLINSAPALIDGFTGKVKVYDIDVHVPDLNERAKWKLDIPLAPRRQNNIWILGTDYDNFSVAYTCDQYGALNLKYAWILTREQHPDKSALAKAYEVVEKNKLRKRYFWKTSQKNCEAKDAVEKN